MRHLLSIADLTPAELARVLDLAARLKADWKAGRRDPVFAGKILGMVFEKPSLRTRGSFEAAMLQGGGNAMYLSPAEIGLGQRESVPDVARVLSRYVDLIMARTFAHQTVVTMAEWATVPVINGLSDDEHPCQALADLLTIQEARGNVAGAKIAFVGDGNNNVSRSLILGCLKLGASLAVASPDGYHPDERFIGEANRAAQPGPNGRPAGISLFQRPESAVRDADFLYTDVWTSMGQESERQERMERFRGYQINDDLLAAAPGHARVMHDLPAHRGEEITDAVMDGPRAIVFDQAENRLWAQKAVMVLLLGLDGEAMDGVRPARTTGD